MLSILHVDFNIFYKKIIKDISEQLDFKYFSADTPQEAFEVLNKTNIDLIITCLEFKDKSGEEFIETLNESIHKNIPVIVLSAKEDIATKNKLFKLGVIDFILKDNFANRLTNYINKIQMEDNAKQYLKNLKIAVLYDNELELRIVQKILELNGLVNVDYYTHSRELLNIQEEYDIYIVDFTLPKTSGHEVIMELRNRYKYSLIMAISFIENENTISNILSIGADDYITKPFSENIFIARLKANLRIYFLLQELKRKNLELERIVNIDVLTNIYNRRYIYNRLEEIVKKSKEDNEKVSVIMFDVDRFKNVNDTYGHQFGDEVLKKVSDNLKEEFRKTDIIGRYGGEEFIVLLPNTNLDYAFKLAEKVRMSICNISFEHGVKITISGGVAELDKENVEGLIEKADKLLYKAKQNGRNRIEFK